MTILIIMLMMWENSGDFLLNKSEFEEKKTFFDENQHLFDYHFGKHFELITLIMGVCEDTFMSLDSGGLCIISMWLMFECRCLLY